MLSLTFKNLRDDEFRSALEKIVNFSGYKDPRVAYNIAKIHRKVEGETDLCQTLFIKLVKQYCEIDEKGDIKLFLNAQTGLPQNYKIKEDLIADWALKLQEFDATVFEIAAHKVPLEALSSVELSPKALAALEPVLLAIEEIK